MVGSRSIHYSSFASHKKSYGPTDSGINLTLLFQQSYGRLHEWSEAYFVTLIARCSFLCVSGQRGAIAKSMLEEHLCVVALTSNGARNPVLSACLLPPCVIAYCSSSTSR